MKEITCLTLFIIFLFSACSSPDQADPREIGYDGEHAITKELQQSMSPPWIFIRILI